MQYRPRSASRTYGIGRPPPVRDASYRRFCRSWRTLVKDRISHPTIAAEWPGLLAMERADRDDLLALQQARLTRLIRDSVRHVPYYRRWAESHGFGPSRLPCLTELPVVSKAEYRAAPGEFLSDRAETADLIAAKTSGSSGEPFRFWQTRAAMDLSYGAFWRALRRHGLRPGDRRVYVWGRSAQFTATSAQLRGLSARQRLRNWLNNTLGLDAYALTEHHVADAVEAIDHFGPQYLHGYVSALYVIARHMVDHGIRWRFRPSLVVTESEKLYRFQRITMEAAFGCPIFQHYGSVEFGNIAQTDPDGHLRINEDLFVVETLPDGQAVITALLSHARPFIRYRIGDLLELGDVVPPGLPYGTIREVTGRTLDLFPTLNGGYVHGMALAHAIDPHLAEVRKYQVRQVAVDHFIITLASARPVSASVTAQIQRDVRALVGPARIDLRAVDDIEPAASGKFRWVVSDVSDVAQRVLGEQREHDAGEPPC